MFEPGTRSVVALSGGPDSTCLLHTMARLRRLLRIELTAFHFDHALRADSGADARYAAAQASKLGVPFVLRRARSRPRRGESVEAWARVERYGALLEVIEETEAVSAAVGHTADDRAETVLLALLRGGGLEALSGMRPVNRPFLRPLLYVTREETAMFCRSLRLRPRRDPMNDDPSFMRVAIRRKVIPAIEKGVGRNVVASLARTASLLEQDADLLEDLARVAASGVVARDGGSRLLMADHLRKLPPALAGRIVRRELLALGSLPEANQVEAVIGLASARPGRRLTLAGGLRARREREYVRLEPPFPRAPTRTAAPAGGS